MEHRLIFAVLFVTLSWIPASIYAQSSSTASTMATTTASGSTATTMAATSTMAQTTTSGSTATTMTATSTMAPTTTSGSTATTMAATSTMAPTTTSGSTATTMTATSTMAPTTTSGSTATTMAATSTMAQTTTSGSTATTMTATSTMAPTTTSGSTATTMAATSTMAQTTTSGSTATTMTATSTMAPTAATGNTATTMAPSTMAPSTAPPTMAPSTAPPTMAPTTTTVVPVVPVALLETTLDRSQCGITQLCAAEPADCDPSTPGSCFFFGAVVMGDLVDCSLSGESDGYVAATLSADNTLGGNDPTYVCANNNGIVQFFTTLLDNDMLTVTELSVSDVQGSVSEGIIQCTFRVMIPTSTTRTTTVTAAIHTGTFNASNGGLGAPNTRIQTNPVDLSNVNATVTNQLNSTTTSATTTTTMPTTTSGAISIQRSFMQALLVTVGMICLAML